MNVHAADRANRDRGTRKIWAMSDPEPGQNRPRAQRRSAVWIGSCHVEGEPSDLWRDCGVFDLSNLGMGMDLRHSSDLVGCRVSVRLPVGASSDVTLTGAVRHAKAGPDGVVRVGIEFVGLSKTERSIVDLLLSALVQGPDRQSQSFL